MDQVLADDQFQSGIARFGTWPTTRGANATWWRRFRASGAYDPSRLQFVRRGGAATTNYGGTAISTAYGYSGGVTEAITGLDKFGDRWYDPTNDGVDQCRPGRRRHESLRLLRSQPGDEYGPDWIVLERRPQQHSGKQLHARQLRQLRLLERACSRTAGRIDPANPNQWLVDAGQQMQIADMLQKTQISELNNYALQLGTARSNASYAFQQANQTATALITRAAWLLQAIRHFKPRRSATSWIRRSSGSVSLSWRIPIRPRRSSGPAAINLPRCSVRRGR